MTGYDSATMRLSRHAPDPTTPTRIVKHYGRGSFLGLISPILAAFMAALGMNGWQRSALRDMENEAIAMARKGYRVASMEEATLPFFGIVSYTVTYESTDRPG